MIGRIRGVLLEKEAPVVLVEVAGVGYELQIPMTTFYQLPESGQEVILYTHFVVREDAQLLYGFLHKTEQSLFRELIKINGVGPKLALTVLSGVTPEIFMQCIMENDLNTLIKLPGVGKKTAERLLIEMRGKLPELQLSLSNLNSATKDAVSALVALGYKPQDAGRIINKYKHKNLSSEELIRSALQELAKS